MPSISAPSSQAHEEKPAPPVFGQILLALMLLFFGALIFFVGWTAISRSHIEFTSDARTPAGASHDVSYYDGAEAVRIGIWLAAFGAMLGVLGLGFAIAICRRGPTGRLARFFGWVSFVCLLVCIGFLAPPWRVGSLPFFATLPAFPILAFALPETSQRKIAPRIFIGLIIAVMVATTIDAGVGTSMALGVFASLGVLGHAVVLFPELTKKLSSETKTA